MRPSTKFEVGDYVYWDGDKDFLWEIESIIGAEITIVEAMGGDRILRHWVNRSQIEIANDTERWFDEFDDDDDDDFEGEPSYAS